MRRGDDISSMDFGRIAEITGGDAGAMRELHSRWLKEKHGNPNPKIDLRLISLFSGLSTASVSYFINGKKGAISAERGDALRKLLDCLHYTPLAAARKLRSKEKKSIAFVSPLSRSPGPEFTLELLQAVKEEAKKFGYYVDVFDVDEGEEESFFRSLPFLGMVDGMILSSLCVEAAMLAPLQEYGIPVVDVHSWKKLSQSPVTDSITPQNTVFSQLLNHLLGEGGFRNPVLVSLPQKLNITRKKKIEVYLEQLDIHGIPFDPARNIVYVDRHSIVEGKRIYPEIFARNPNVDAIVCLSDTIAMTIAQELAAEGRKVAVTGYDNLGISELFNITTIDQNLKDTGHMAFEKLYYAIRYIQKNGIFPEYSETMMDLKFIPRASSMKK